jgi:hypothetical protein
MSRSSMWRLVAILVVSAMAITACGGAEEPEHGPDRAA